MGELVKVAMPLLLRLCRRCTYIKCRLGNTEKERAKGATATGLCKQSGFVALSTIGIPRDILGSQAPPINSLCPLLLVKYRGSCCNASKMAGIAPNIVWLYLCISNPDRWPLRHQIQSGVVSFPSVYGIRCGKARDFSESLPQLHQGPRII